MKAYHPGTCALCKRPIFRGDEIYRHCDTGQMRHKDCDKELKFEDINKEVERILGY